MTLTQHQARSLIDAAAAMRQPRLQHSSFSIQRALKEMVTNQGLSDRGSFEGVTCAAAAADAGEHFDPHRIRIPMHALFSRDLNVTIPGQGGELVQHDVPEAWRPLVPYSPVLQAGANVQRVQRGDIYQPVVTGDPTAVSLSGEASPITESNITFGQVKQTPHGIGAYCEISRSLLMSAPNVDVVVPIVMLEKIGKELSRLALVGNGAAGQVQGVAGRAGIGTASGTSLGWGGVLDARASAVAAADDTSLSWIGGSVAHRILSARERATGSGFIWDNRQIGGLPAYASAAAPTDGLFLGAWSQMHITMWGDSLVVEMNPYQPGAFQAGIVGFRVLLYCDVAISSPAYFSHIPSIT